jgi:hypothetical protein
MYDDESYSDTDGSTSDDSTDSASFRHNAMGNKPPASLSEMGDGRPWATNDALEELILDKSFDPNVTSEQSTRSILENNAPLAARRIVHIALYSSNDNTSLSASKYITDFVLQQEGDTRAVWEQALGESIIETAEQLTKAPGGQV